MSLVWANGAMRRLEEEMRCASMTDASVMLTGESGVGKRFAANMIHQLSQRRRAPFVAIDAADVLSATPPAGVGATVAVGGAFLQAPDDGTLLIQDIEKMPAAAQSQLLGFMDRATTVKRHARLMTATTAHLFRLVQTGLFRDDLFYRLNVIHFTIPPLRERREDIPLMFRSLLVVAREDRGAPAVERCAPPPDRIRLARQHSRIEDGDAAAQRGAVTRPHRAAAPALPDWQVTAEFSVSCSPNAI